MLEAGESAVTLARWLGHSSHAIILRYYAHFMPEAGRRGHAAIDGLLGGNGEMGRPTETPQILPRPVGG
ncbi:integrase [Streptomyces sp. SID3212]|uniref:integrase n=1 Tax=Streptomyces sp. SID3212 TaxID=2690259 RepID=UPI001F3E339C|nr:integrase [Streptomyces sp. SID3212]